MPTERFTEGIVLRGRRFSHLAVLRLCLALAYLGVEVYSWIRAGQVLQGKTKTQVLWVLAVVSILAATFFQRTSVEVGDLLCNASSPTSFFQPHGMLWHPLAGVMAVLLYFYWREADDPI